jgi:hypothetical protein
MKGRKEYDVEGVKGYFCSMHFVGQLGGGKCRNFSRWVMLHCVA